MHIFMANFKMRANTCTYFQNGSPLRSSAQNIDILSGSNRSVYCQLGYMYATKRLVPMYRCTLRKTLCTQLSTSCIKFCK